MKWTSIGPTPTVGSLGNPLIFKTIDVRVHKYVKSFRGKSEERKKGAGCQTVFPFLFVHTFFSGIQLGNIVTSDHIKNSGIGMTKSKVNYV